MADLTDIVAKAAREADAGGEIDTDTDETETNNSTDTADPAEDIEASTETDEVETADALAEDASPSEKAQIVEPDELIQELESLGLKAPIEGQRENRLPYSRVKKIVENARKKLLDSHTAALSEHETKYSEAQKRLENMDAVDHLIETDPERYISMLAALHPEKYKRFLAGQAQASDAASRQASDAKLAAADPAPKPDAKYEDGSVGYSPEGLQALLDWQARQVEQRVTAKLDETYTKRFGPIEREWQMNRTQEQQLPVVRQQISGASKLWGKLFDDDYAKNDKSEILKVMRANDGEQGRPYLSFDACVAQVLLPSLHAAENTKRTSLIKEINARPKAATKHVPGATSGAKEVPASRSIEDIVREAAATLG